MQSLVTVCLRQYKRWISPMMAPHCRFYPSCSSYAIEAIERHGLIRGGVLSVSRILRCNPFFKGGVDPVPGVNSASETREEPRGVTR